MNKIALIIRREYLTRVRKKSFIIMSILGPILFAALLILPGYLASLEDKEVKTVAVIDDSHILSYQEDGQMKSIIPDTEYLKFVVLDGVKPAQLKENFESTGYHALLYIPENIINSETSILYSDKQPSLDVSSHIKNALEQELEQLKLVATGNAAGIENIDKLLSEISTSIRVSNIKWTKDGEEKQSSTGLSMGIGYIGGFMIYMFIFIYGAMVMRGVIEEKTSRIVEVIVSSVRPFQLMMGKIVGVGMVGLTQFVIWVVFTLVLVTGVNTAFPDLLQQQQATPVPTTQAVSSDLFSEGNGAITAQPSEDQAELSQGDQFLQDILGGLDAVDPLKIVLAFLFYFLAGYLMYGSLFAMIGAAVDNETETQQFMLPVTLPLVLGIIVMVNVMNNPHGALAFWFSMIPLTSPVVMMVRMPFDVPTWELALSATLLIATILGAIWIAGKIYRTGILMYGKKVTYKELWKWLRYKN